MDKKKHGRMEKYTRRKPKENYIPKMFYNVLALKTDFPWRRKSKRVNILKGDGRGDLRREKLVLMKTEKLTRGKSLTTV